MSKKLSKATAINSKSIRSKKSTGTSRRNGIPLTALKQICDKNDYEKESRGTIPTIAIFAEAYVAKIAQEAAVLVGTKKSLHTEKIIKEAIKFANTSELNDSNDVNIYEPEFMKNKKKKSKKPTKEAVVSKKKKCKEVVVSKKKKNKENEDENMEEQNKEEEKPQKKNKKKSKESSEEEEEEEEANTED